MTLPVDPEFEQDFHDVLNGVRDDLYSIHERIYRHIEAQVIEQFQILQRVQREIGSKLLAMFPGYVDDVR